MRNLGEIWSMCHDGTIPNGEWDYERRLNINGVEYLDNNIVKVTHNKGLVGNTISFGNTISSRIKTTVIPPTSHTVNRGDEIQFQLRVVTLNDGVSDWHNFGFYYIESAEKEDDKWSITGYDLLSSLETPFMGSDNTSSRNALIIILQHLDIQIHGSILDIPSHNLEGTTEYTMREILGYIGSLSLGNWTITENNELKLVKISTGLDPKAIINKGNSKRIIDGGGLKFTKVTLKYGSSKKDRYTAGSGSEEIEIYNPWGTQSMADSLLNVVSNYTFHTGDVRSTDIDPAVQLGDIIEIDGRETNLWKVDYSTRMYADIQVPDKTNRFSQSYEFEASGGNYDEEIEDLQTNFNDLQDKLDVLIEMSGTGDVMEECVLLSESNTTIISGYANYSGDDSCVVIPRRLYEWGDIYRLDWLFSEDDINIDRVIMNTPNEIIGVRYLFSGRRDTNDLDLSKFNTENIVNMREMFRDHKNSTIDLSNFNTSKVTNMVEMFRVSSDITSSGYGLTKLDLSSFDTSNVTNMEGMFEGSRVVSLDLSPLDTSSVTNMRFMFYSFKETSLDLSSLDTGNVTDMTSMFAGALYKAYTNKIENLNLSSLDTSNVTDMSRMFSGSSVKDLDLSSFDTSSVTSMREMFWHSSMKSIDLPSSETSPNGTTMFAMFRETDIPSIDFSSFDTSNVTNMQAMFRGPHSGIVNLDLSSFDTSNVTNMEGMFYIHRDMKTVDLSSFDTSNVTNMSRMFAGCDGLTSLDLSSFDTSNVTKIDSFLGTLFSTDLKTIYFRTEEDKNRIVSSRGFPKHEIMLIVVNQ